MRQRASFSRRKLLRGLRYILWTTKIGVNNLFCLSLHSVGTSLLDCKHLCARRRDAQIMGKEWVLEQRQCNHLGLSPLSVRSNCCACTCCHEDPPVLLLRPRRYCCLAHPAPCRGPFAVPSRWMARKTTHSQWISIIPVLKETLHHSMGCT